jgi:biopolymer transport protein ExbD
MSIKSTRKELEEVEDINMTPIMSLFVILIPFLLLAAVFVKVSIISSPFPKLGGASSQKQDKTLFVLDIKIKMKGIEITTTGNKRRRKKTHKIPKLDGEYQYDKVHALMVQVKRYFPKEYRMNLFPDGKVPYDAIIQLMDATRKVKKGDPALYIKDEYGKQVQQEYLFPDVVWMGVLT